MRVHGNSGLSVLSWSCSLECCVSSKLVPVLRLRFEYLRLAAAGICVMHVDGMTAKPTGYMCVHLYPHVCASKDPFINSVTLRGLFRLFYSRPLP